MGEGNELFVKGTGRSLVQVDWMNGCALVASMVSSVTSTLPLPVSLVVNGAPLQLAVEGDDSVFAGLEDSVVITIDLFFPDGHARDVTFDPELNFDLTTDLVIEIVDNGLLLQTTSLSRPGPSQVIFTYGDTPLVARFNVSIVIFESLRLEVHPYPQYPGSMDVAVHTLHKIGGTNVFQSGVLELVVVLSDSCLLYTSDAADE